MTPPPPVDTDAEVFPVPGDSDPSKWSEAECDLYGVPPKPDTSQARLYQAWTRTFGHKLQFIRYIPEAAERTDVPRTSHVGGVIVRTDAGEPTLVSRATRFVTSPNWSGATLDARSNRRFKQIYGDWIVTNVTQPPGEGDGTFQCASWIGIDGQRHYLNATLPQVGTLETLIVDPSGVPREPLLQAWTQWWAPNDPSATPAFIKGFPLKFNDRISAVITVTGRHHVLCNLVNQSTDPPTIVCIKRTAPRIPDPLLSVSSLREQYSLTGATAGWVLERPAVIGKPDDLERLCNYGETTFSCCLAVETELNGSKPIARDLGSARLIRMFQRRHDPERTVYLSMPERTDDEGFRMRFGDVWPDSAVSV